jgi:hypothetical protein
MGMPMLVTLRMAALSPFSCPACLGCIAVGIQAAGCCCLCLQTHAHGVAQPGTACLLGTQRSSQFPSSTFHTRTGALTPRTPAPQSPPSSPQRSPHTLLSAAATEVRRLTWVGDGYCLEVAPLCAKLDLTVGGVLSQPLCKMQALANPRLLVEAADQLAVVLRAASGRIM